MTLQTCQPVADSYCNFATCIATCYTTIFAATRQGFQCCQQITVLLLQLDKLCPYTVKTAQPLPPTTGTAEWVPTEHVPNAAYFIRALVYCPNSTYGTSPCGVGNSKGFFQVDQINSRPGNLIGAVIGMCFAGPIFFFSYFAIDSLLSKRKSKKSPDAGHAQHNAPQMDEKVSTLT